VNHTKNIQACSTYPAEGAVLVCNISM